MPKRVLEERGEQVQSGDTQDKAENAQEDQDTVEANEEAEAEEKRSFGGGRGDTLMERARRAFKLGSEMSDEQNEQDEIAEEEQTASVVEDVEQEQQVEPATEQDHEEEYEEGEEDEGDEEEEEVSAEGQEAQPASFRKIIERLESKIDQLEKESGENYDKYLRSVAELENFKKRTAKERSDLIRYAGESLAYDILEVADNLERAVAQEVPGSVEELMQGVKMILDRCNTVLEKHSIKGEDASGVEFDPTKHEALATVPTAEVASGTIIEQFRKPYMFKDKLLRTAQVVVAAPLQKEPDSNQQAGESAELEQGENSDPEPE